MADIMEEYLDVFIEEAEEHIQTINECLLELEKNPDNLDLINQIFRSAHTIKGGARTVGLTHVSELTHHMEDILDYIRNGKIPVTSEIIDLLFKCLDALETMLEEVKSGNYETEVDVNSLIEEIKRLKNKYLEGKEEPSPKKEEKKEEKKEVKKEEEKKEESKAKIKKIVIKYKQPKTTVKVKKIIKEVVEVPKVEVEEDFEESIKSIKNSLEIFQKIADILGDEKFKTFLDEIKLLIEKIEKEEVIVTKSVYDTLEEIIETLEKIAKILEENKKPSEEINLDEIIEKIKKAQEEEETETKEITKEEEIEVELNHEQFDLSEFAQLIKEKIESGYKLYHLKAKVEESCELKAARLAVVFARVRNIGEILLSKPTEGELKEKPTDEIEIIFLSNKDLEEIKKTLEGLPEIEYVAIAPVEIEIEEIEEEIEEEVIEEEETVPDAYKVVVYLDDEC